MPRFIEFLAAKAAILLSNNNEDLLCLIKRSILFVMLAHGLTLICRADVFFFNDWAGYSNPILELEQPTIFLILAKCKNQWLTLSFAICECLIVSAAFFFYRSQTLMLGVIFFSMNTYNYLWAVQDGGNNLSHILCYYLLLATFEGSEFDWIMKKMSIQGRHRLEIRNTLNTGAVFLTRIQIIFVYLAAVVAKLLGSKWQNGTVLYYLAQSDYFGVGWFAQTLAKYPALSALGTYSAIAFQVVFAFLVLQGRWRVFCLLAGIFFHTGIAVTMNLYLFSATMIAVYSAFLTNDQAGESLAYLWPRSPIHVAFDRSCRICSHFAHWASICSRSGAAVIIDQAQSPKNLDLTMVSPQQRLSSIHSYDGCLHSGFSTISAILRRTYIGPIAMPVVWLLEWSSLGERLYKKVAAHRLLKRCRYATCDLNLPKESL